MSEKDTTHFGYKEVDKSEKAEFQKSADAVQGLIDACRKIAPDLGR